MYDIHVQTCTHTCVHTYTYAYILCTYLHIYTQPFCSVQSVDSKRFHLHSSVVLLSFCRCAFLEVEGRSSP